jgi:hypothetical protein
VHASPNKFFSYFFFEIFPIIFCRVLLFAECPTKSTRKDLFADRFFAERSLPSAKNYLPSARTFFAECKRILCRVPRHSAKKVNPVLNVVGRFAQLSQAMYPSVIFFRGKSCDLATSVAGNFFIMFLSSYSRTVLLPFM